MIPAAITAEVETLRQEGHHVSVSEGIDGFLHLVIDDYRIPDGYNLTTIRLLIKLPVSYPNGSPDMFWTNNDLRLVNEGLPESTIMEAVNGTTWLRFSWHSSKWTPGANDLLTYLEFINRRLLLKK